MRGCINLQKLAEMLAPGVTSGVQLAIASNVNPLFPKSTLEEALKPALVHLIQHYHSTASHFSENCFPELNVMLVSAKPSHHL